MTTFPMTPNIFVGAVATKSTMPTPLPEGPKLDTPYRDHKGEVITNYRDIRQHQVKVVQAYVQEHINRTYKGAAVRPDTIHAMKWDALRMLHHSKQCGHLHPATKIENWIVHDDLNRIVYNAKRDKQLLSWTGTAQREIDQLYAWMPSKIDELRQWIGTSLDVEWNGHIYVPCKKQQLKDKIRRQLEPDLLNHRGVRMRAAHVSFRNTKQNEILALQLLRSMVEPDVFKRYLKYGFVTVVGSSGLTYQIVRKSHLITVWEHGTKIAELCVYTKGIPPTDEVIAKMLICECDEPDIWKRANVRWKTLVDKKLLAIAVA